MLQNYEYCGATSVSPYSILEHFQKEKESFQFNASLTSLSLETIFTNVWGPKVGRKQIRLSGRKQEMMRTNLKRRDLKTCTPYTDAPG